MAQPFPNSRLLSIPYLDSKLTLSSRWEYSTNGAIWSGWAGSSIKFYAQDFLSPLFMRIGPKTQRKDRWNGGTPMFSVSITKSSPPNQNSDPPSAPVIETKVFDGEPGMLVQLWDEPIQQCSVEIILIDWASILEIDGFISDDSGYVVRSRIGVDPSILFIGDSITCGLALEHSDGGQPMPRGLLDAFPSRAISILSKQRSYPLSLEVVAYPGISLVSPDQRNDDESASITTLGMVDRFFHKSPWEPSPWTPRGIPHCICIALGTNDEANDIAPQLFRATLARFIRTLSATFPSVEAFYVIPPFRDFNEPDVGFIHTDLVSNPLVVDDLDVRTCYDLGSKMTAEHTVDGLHPSVAGHTLLAENLAHFLKTHRPPDRDQ
ncbi:hypothetical protein C8R44DRAFT_758715 [Mycena epipterygia]|nr:hypothetical protein C8R44DRAFT_758715 [Mycena epipterygia]